MRAGLGRTGGGKLLREGDGFERFVVERFLGDGFHGEVYAVREGKELSALKIMRDPREPDPEGERRFRDEGAVFSKVRHRNLVNIFETGVAEGGYYWTRMELLSGGTLRDELAQHRWVALPAAIRYLRHAFAGAHQLHHLGIIHRDLKPENMMLVRAPGRPSVLKLVDFNTAKFQQGEARLSAGGSGTPAYMAPEQLRPQGRRVGPWTDVYAICLVAWEMLAGEHPFVAAKSTSDVVMWRVASEEVPSLRRFGVPREIAEVIAKGLAERPEDRFPTAARAAEALTEALRQVHERAARGDVEDEDDSEETQDGRRASGAVITARRSLPIELIQASLAGYGEEATPARNTIPGGPPEEILSREKEVAEEIYDRETLPLTTVPHVLTHAIVQPSRAAPRDVVPESAGAASPASAAAFRASPPGAGLRWDLTPAAPAREGAFFATDMEDLEEILPPVFGSFPPQQPATERPLDAPLAAPPPRPALSVPDVALILPSSFAPPATVAPPRALPAQAPAPLRAAPRRPAKRPISATQVLALGVIMLGLAFVALLVWMASEPGRLRSQVSPSASGEMAP